MEYRDCIRKLVERVDINLADFSSERIRGNMPTQISSEFLTNKEQGDWAENTLLNGINNNSNNLIAVHYGKMMILMLEMMDLKSSLMIIRMN
ncbi:MAG: AccI family restriction endonuclease [Eubacterium sp.]|nr:AccI family restriction endonuclease [Eubacterium sp.]